MRESGGRTGTASEMPPTPTPMMKRAMRSAITSCEIAVPHCAAAVVHFMRHVD
jgi:hypothetical protein